MIVAGLGTVVSVATVESAQASSPNSPTAIGVTSDGTSYVGFASGGKLLKLSPNGGRKGTIPLDQDEAVMQITFVSPFFGGEQHNNTSRTLTRRVANNNSTQVKMTHRIQHTHKPHTHSHRTYTPSCLTLPLPR